MPAMKKMILSAAMLLPLAACATTAPPSPVEVTRFHDSAALDALGEGSIFVETAPGTDADAADSLELSTYKAAIARELSKLGYAEADRASAGQVAQVKVERYVIAPEAPRRGPVSVGVGGSTGSYGSGVGLGLGINLGGNKNTERLGTDMSVMIRDVATNDVLWEGRAQFSSGSEAPEAQAAANAAIMAEALFRNFPGGQGETVQIEVTE